MLFMSEEHIPKELGIARISIKIFLTQLAEILDEPSLKNVDPSTTVFPGEVNSLDSSGNITVNIDERDKTQGAIKINTLLEEVSHFAYDQINSSVSSYYDKAQALIPKDPKEKTEAIRSLMFDKNMLEFFAKMCALQLLTRPEIRKLLTKLLKKSEQTQEAMDKYVEHLCEFAYHQELSECQNLIRDEDNAVTGMEYMEAYALITSIPKEIITGADLSQLARLPFDELREWAYNAAEGRQKGRAKKIREWYEKLEKDYIDSGFWEMGQRGRS